MGPGTAANLPKAPEQRSSCSVGEFAHVPGPTMTVSPPYELNAPDAINKHGSWTKQTEHSLLVHHAWVYLQVVGSISWAILEELAPFSWLG